MNILEMPLKRGRILQRKIENGVVIMDVVEGIAFIVENNQITVLKKT